MIQYRVGEWRSGPLAVADGFRKRLVGLLRSPAHGIVIRAKSVHGIGMPTTIGLIGIDRAGRVVRTATLRPWRFVFWWDVTRIIEVPHSTGLPTPPWGPLVEVDVEVPS